MPAMGGPQLSVAVDEVDPRTARVRPAGDLDLRGSAVLRQVLEGLREKGVERIEIDLSEVAFMDSTGLSVLIAFRRRLAASAVVTLTGMTPEVHRLLRMTGLEEQFAAADRKTAEEDMPAAGAHPGGPERGQHAPTPLHSLSGDAATALAIAATALPFASSADEQAERWLRALRRHGDAGVILGSLGISDELTGAAGEDERDLLTAPPADPVAAVTNRAAEIAHRHGTGSSRTSDLLEAVRDTYGAAFQRALARHAADPEDVTQRLDELLRQR
jgi:anti-sigma B factor antagonist